MTERRSRPIEILSVGELETLLSCVGTSCPTAVRNSTLITVLYRSGLRIGEALGLVEKDIDYGCPALRVLRGKGGRARTVGIDAASMKTICRWADLRRRVVGSSRGPLFCTLQGRPLSPSYVRRVLKRKADEAGITKRVHPHGLRHTHAAELASEGVPINIISKQLGHSNIATTSHYLDHIAPQQVIETMRNRGWGN